MAAFLYDLIAVDGGNSSSVKYNATSYFDRNDNSLSRRNISRGVSSRVPTGPIPAEPADENVIQMAQISTVEPENEPVEFDAAGTKPILPQPVPPVEPPRQMELRSDSPENQNSSSSVAPVAVYTQKVATPVYVDSAIQRALAFHANGQNFLRKGENFSALLNFALVANTLTELKNFVADDSAAALSNVRVPRELCASGFCGSVDDALQQALSMVACLQKRVVEIRSGAIEMMSSSSLQADEKELNTRPRASNVDNKEDTEMIEEQENFFEGGASDDSTGVLHSASLPVISDGNNVAESGGSGQISSSTSYTPSKTSVSILNWTEKLCRENCFERLIGNDEAKQRIKDLFVSPLLYPNMYGKMGKGLLLYGPPGTGKTALARAMVSEIHRRSGGTIEVILLTPQGDDFRSKYIGESERKIKELFMTASRLACEAQHQYATENGSSADGSSKTKPIKQVISIIFIDEIDSIAESRDSKNEDSSGSANRSSVNALLQQMDGISSFSNVAVVGATNFPEKIDLAVKRRLSQEIYVKLPSAKDIELMIYLNINKLITDVVLPEDLENAGKNCTVGRSSNSKGGEGEQNHPPKYSCGSRDYAACADLKDTELWMQFKDIYFTTLFSERSKVEQAAKKLEALMYSPSDVNEFFSRCLRRAAEVAMQNNIFIVGPVMSTRALEGGTLGHEKRGFISIEGLRTEKGPFSPLKVLQDQVREFEKARLTKLVAGVGLNAQKIEEYFKKLETSTDLSQRRKIPGTIIVGPAKYSSFIDKVVVTDETGDKFTFKNIAVHGGTLSSEFTLSLAHYVPDFLVDEVFIEIDENTKTQKTDRVLFNIVFPVTQGEIEGLTDETPNCRVSEGYDELPSILIRQKLESENMSADQIETFFEEFYCPGKRDFVNLFVMVKIDTIKQAYSKKIEGGYFNTTISSTADILEEIFNNDDNSFMSNIYGTDIFDLLLLDQNTKQNTINTMIKKHSDLQGNSDPELSPVNKGASITYYLADLKKNGIVINTKKMYSKTGHIFGIDEVPKIVPATKVYVTAPYSSSTSKSLETFRDQRSEVDIVYNAHFLNWGVTGEIIKSEADKGIKSMSSDKKVIEGINAYAAKNPPSTSNGLVSTWLFGNK